MSAETVKSLFIRTFRPRMHQMCIISFGTLSRSRYSVTEDELLHLLVNTVSDMKFVQSAQFKNIHQYKLACSSLEYYYV